MYPGMGLKVRRVREGSTTSITHISPLSRGWPWPGSGGWWGLGRPVLSCRHHPLDHVLVVVGEGVLGHGGSGSSNTGLKLGCLYTWGHQNVVEGIVVIPAGSVVARLTHLN